MKIEIIKSQKSDNFFYLLTADDGGDGILIDPVDADAALARVEALGAQVKMVVNTHWHPDHTGGNAQVIDATKASLAIPAQEAGWIADGDQLLAPGDTLRVGDTELKVLLVPGHTQGHIALYAAPYLFSGDAIFVGGAGNARFGSPQVLFRTFRDVLRPLPDDTIFYPGHDYAVRNFEFCLHVQPDNTAAQEALERAKEHRGAG